VSFGTLISVGYVIKLHTFSSDLRVEDYSLVFWERESAFLPLKLTLSIWEKKDFSLMIILYFKRVYDIHLGFHCRCDPMSLFIYPIGCERVYTGVLILSTSK
jgi:hypothetical protein